MESNTPESNRHIFNVAKKLEDIIVQQCHHLNQLDVSRTNGNSSNYNHIFEMLQSSKYSLTCLTELSYKYYHLMYKPGLSQVLPVSQTPFPLVVFNALPPSNIIQGDQIPFHSCSSQLLQPSPNSAFSPLSNFPDKNLQNENAFPIIPKNYSQDSDLDLNKENVNASDIICNEDVSQQSHNLNEISTSKNMKTNENECNMQVPCEESSQDSDKIEMTESKSNNKNTSNLFKNSIESPQLPAASSLDDDDDDDSPPDKSHTLTQAQSNTLTKQMSSTTSLARTSDKSKLKLTNVKPVDNIAQAASKKFEKIQTKKPVLLENRDPNLGAEKKLTETSCNVDEYLEQEDSEVCNMSPRGKDPRSLKQNLTNTISGLPSDNIGESSDRIPLKDSNTKVTIGEQKRLSEEPKSKKVSFKIKSKNTLINIANNKEINSTKTALTKEVAKKNVDSIFHSKYKKTILETSETKASLKRAPPLIEQLVLGKLPKIPKLAGKSFTIEDSKSNESTTVQMERTVEKSLEKQGSTLGELQWKKGVNSKPVEKDICKFSGTQHSVQDILAQRRAARAKASVNIQSTPHVEYTKRMFGKDFSPTMYTPDKGPLVQPRVLDVEALVRSDRDLFLQVLLYNETSNLRFENDDTCITSAIRLIYEQQNFNLNEEREAPLTYQSLEHYKSYFTPLVIYDVWAQICRASRNTFLETISLTKTSMLEENTWTILVLKGSIFNTRLYDITNWSVTLTNESGHQSVLGFIDSQIHINETQQSTFADPRLARNGHRSLFQFRIRVSQKYRQYVENWKRLEMKQLFYLKPSLRLIETLARMQDRSDFIQTIISPALDDSPPNEIPSFTFLDQEEYNRFQQDAIVRCCNVAHQRYTSNKIMMIQGPPGTGKTHTIVGIVKNLFHNLEHNEDKPLRILICAPSNGAIDEIARRLINLREFPREQRSVIKKLKVVRIGIKDQVHPDIRDYQLDSLIDSNMRKGFHREHLGPDRRKLVRDDILAKADVILATLQSCQQASMQNLFKQETSKLAIRCLIVDEASQCVEPEILMPLIYKSISKVILIGDHRQLPATVISKKASKLCYGRSMFERFYQKMHQDHSKLCDDHYLPIITLELQFRMKYEICRFPSMQFYDNALRTEYNSGANPKIPLRSYFVFDLQNTHERNVHSKSNDLEVEFVLKLLLSALEIIQKSNSFLEKDDKKVSIGVITFYRSQCEAINSRVRQRINQQEMPNVVIDVNTVDAFQGQERDIVILSCVRAFDPTCDRSIGFVQSQQRMNVAITRAKSVLYICLDGKVFQHNPCWQPLLTDVQKRNRYVRTNISISDAELKRKILSQ